jgi:hypothetical protein
MARRRGAIATRTVYVPKVRYRTRRPARRRFTPRGIAGFALGLPPTATAVVGAAILGWGVSESHGAVMQNWKVGKLSVPWTVGLAAYIAGRWTGSPLLRHLATGMLSVAAYQTVVSGEVLGGDDDGGYGDVAGADV